MEHLRYLQSLISKRDQKLRCTIVNSKEHAMAKDITDIFALTQKRIVKARQLASYIEEGKIRSKVIECKTVASIFLGDFSVRNDDINVKS